MILDYLRPCRPLSFVILAVILMTGAGAGAEAESRMDLSRPVAAAGELLAGIEVSGAIAPGLYDRDVVYQERPGLFGGTYWQVASGLWAGYGINDSVGVAVGFSPGAVIVSRYFDGENRRRAGVSDLVLSGVVRLWGQEGLLGGAALRTAPLEVWLKPRLVLAMPAPDYAEALENRRVGESYVAANQDLHAFGAGIEFDVVVDLRSGWRVATGHQLDIFLPSDYNESGLAAYEQNQLRDALSTVDPFETIWYRYRYRGAIETEWAASPTWLLQPVIVDFEYRPSPIVDDLDPLSDTDASLLRLGLGTEGRILRSGGRAPVLLRATYLAPVLGKNRGAEHLLVLSVAFKIL